MTSTLLAFLFAAVAAASNANETKYAVLEKYTGEGCSKTNKNARVYVYALGRCFNKATISADPNGKITYTTFEDQGCTTAPKVIFSEPLNTCAAWVSGSARFTLTSQTHEQVKSSLATAIVPYTPAVEFYDNNQCTGVVPLFLLQMSVCVSSQSLQCTSSWENPYSISICNYAESDCQGTCSKDSQMVDLCLESSTGIYRKFMCSSYVQITTTTKVIAPTVPKVVDHPVSAGEVAAAILTPLVIVVIVAVVIFFVIRKKMCGSSNGTPGGAGSGNTSSSYGSV